MGFHRQTVNGAGAAGNSPALLDGNAVSRQLAQSFVRPPGKLLLLYGDDLLFRLSLLMAAQAIAHGGSCAVVDGGNHFDVHLLSRFARERGIVPDDFLNHIFISRGFTCYQMEQAIVNRLPAFLRRIHSTTAMVFGLLDTCYDEQAPLREVRQIVGRILEALRRMKEDGMSVLVACTEWNVLPAERNELFESVRTAMDRVYRLERKEKDRPKLFLEKGVNPHGTHRTDLYEHHRQRVGELVEIPPRPAQGRPGIV
ncbi:MAG TPA: hypothetical protein VMM57_09725 [Bacteroidota bacterium]|nr:hypothetical protein [Bacteroidota bacterium]